jgi:hypothetical protein
MSITDWQNPVHGKLPRALSHLCLSQPAKTHSNCDWISAGVSFSGEQPIQRIFQEPIHGD